MTDTKTLPSGLNLVGVAKSFQGVVALRGVSLSVPFGQIHALIGENGAGKSTLVKILSGNVDADRGSLTIGERQLSITGRTGQRIAGIATAYQELSLIPEWDVATNLLYGVEPQVRAGRVSPRALHAKAKELLDLHNVGAIRPNTLVRQLSLADRQMVEILRAVHAEQPVLLLDEPTSALPAGRVQWFYDLIRSFLTPTRLVLFISHRLEEVRALCSQVTVLRDGADVGHGPIEDMSEDRLVQLMLGEERGRLKAVDASRHSKAKTSVVCSLDQLAVAPRLKPTTLEIRAGEIVGVAALEGEGQLDLFLALFGMRKSTGQVTIKGRQVTIRSPMGALRAGIGLVPQDRGEGLCLPLTIAENVVLGDFQAVSRFGILRGRRLRQVVGSAIRTFRIRCWSSAQLVSELSGGNQQKVLLARVLAREPALLLLYDATRGVDVATKADIFQLVRDRTESGAGVLYYSTDIAELLELTDRVVVIHNGQVVAQMDHAELTRERILSAAVGFGSA